MGSFFQQASGRAIRIAGPWIERARPGLPVIALFFLTLIFFSDILLSNGLFIERDLASFFIPPRAFWVKSLKAGEFPFWNPLSFGGCPLFATLQPGVFYPPNLLFFILPFNNAFNWIIIAHFFLASAFTYAFLRFLGVGRGASFLGGIVFLLGGYLLSLHSLLSALLSVAWLPLVLLLFGRALRHDSLWSAVWAGVVLAVSFLGGGVETVLGTCVALGLMAVFSRPFGGNVVFALKALVVTGTVFVGLVAIQVLPFLELSRLSIRQNGLSYKEAIVWSASPVDFLSFLVQDPYGSLRDISKYWVRQSWLKTLYVGGLPFLLAIIYLIKGTREKYFWVVLAALSVFFALGGFNPLYSSLYDIVPGVNKIRYPVKFLFLAMFALCIMAGLGLQRLLDAVRQGEGKRFQWAAIILATTTAIVFFALHTQHARVLAFLKTAGFDTPVYNDATVNLYNFKRMLLYVVLSSMVLWVITKTKGSRYAVAALCLVLVLDLFGNIGYYVSADSRVYWADNWTVRQVKAGLGEYRVLTTPYTVLPTSTVMAPNLNSGALPQRVLTPAVNLNYGIRDLWGAEVMRLKRTDDLYNVLSLTPSIDATRLLDFSSTKYVITTKRISSRFFLFLGADIEGLGLAPEKVLVEPTIKIYRNTRVLPRAFLVHGYQVAPDQASALLSVTQRDFNPAKTVVLEEQPIWDANIPSNEMEKKTANAKILRDKNNEVTVQARVAQPSLLYLADTFYPGWNAYVDGEKTKIYRANYNFRAVPLSPGEHRVEFRYEPLSFYIGAGITGVTVLLLMVFGVRGILRRRNKTAQPATDQAMTTL